MQWAAKDLTGRSGRAGSAAHRARRRITGEARVFAPMPGRVVRVLVAAGEVVARQGLIIVEAMKMENELGAPRGGRVREVTVTEGHLGRIGSRPRRDRMILAIS